MMETRSKAFVPFRCSMDSSSILRTFLTSKKIFKSVLTHCSHILSKQTQLRRCGKKAPAPSLLG